MLDFSSLGSGILSSAYDGSVHTCMHHLETVNRLIAGIEDGSLRFGDIEEGQKLHLWRSDSSESSFPSLISSICSRVRPRCKLRELPTHHRGLRLD
ncbi:hypothetical protein Hdeb2414_s0026g00683061 [Helianthus debilis subsp. tardiflorus]